MVVAVGEKTIKSPYRLASARGKKKKKGNSRTDWTERNVGLESPNLPRCTVLLDTDELFFDER